MYKDSPYIIFTDYLRIISFLTHPLSPAVQVGNWMRDKRVIDAMKVDASRGGESINRRPRSRNKGNKYARRLLTLGKTRFICNF